MTRTSAKPSRLLPSLLWLVVLSSGPALAGGQAGPVYDVKAFGAKGDGVTIDTPAITAAVEAAAKAGGGTCTT